MKELAAALLAAQKAMPVIRKDSQAEVKGRTKDGREYTYTYTYLSLPQLLDVVVPVLNAQDLALTQMPSHEGALRTLVTTLIHGPSGETYIHSSPVVLADTATPQEWGGAITYARRYALTALLGIAADEDDDAQAASSVRAAARPSPTPGAAQPFEPQGQPDDGGDPLQVVVTFGNKHKDERLGKIITTDRGYLEWLTSDKFEPKTADQRRVVEAAKVLLATDDDIPF